MRCFVLTFHWSCSLLEVLLTPEAPAAQQEIADEYIKLAVKTFWSCVHQVKLHPEINCEHPLSRAKNLASCLWFGVYVLALQPLVLPLDAGSRPHNLLADTASDPTLTQRKPLLLALTSRMCAQSIPAGLQEIPEFMRWMTILYRYLRRAIWY